MFAQLFLACGYLSILVMPILLALGTYLRQPALALGVAMLGFPLARAVFGAYPQSADVEWRESISTLLDRLPIFYAAVLLVSLVWVLASIDAGIVNSPSHAVGLGLSLWMTLLFATCVAHELIHRRNLDDARIGQVVAGLAGYPLMSVEHISHHRGLDDPARAECPEVNESVWHFALRRLKRIGRDALMASASIGPVTCLAGLRRALGARSTIAAITTAVTCASFAWAGGWLGLAIYLAACAGVTLGIQIITYLQHWGLGRPSNSAGRHPQIAWEDDCLFQSWVTLHISFHQAHHQLPQRPYYRLDLSPNSPRAPAGYVVLMLLCMIPPLWRRLMMPALQHWRQQPEQPQSSGRRLTCFSVYPGGAAATDR